MRYSCSQCDYKATLQSNLKIHIESVHEDVKYPCSQCDWHSNASHFQEVLGNLFDTGESSDVTLVCDYQERMKDFLRTGKDLQIKEIKEIKS